MAAQPAEAAAHQATPGQREPSMEEILASIRRIIEDSDNNRAEANAEAPAAIIQPTIIPPAANSSKPAEKPEEREVDTFRRELGETKPAESAPVAVAKPPVDTTSPPRSAAPAAAVTSPASKAAAPAPRSDMPARIEKPIQAVRTEQPARSDAALTTEVMQREWRQRLSMPLAPTPMATEAVAAPATATAPVPAQEAGKGGILSEVAGRQVAAAFGELSDAFAATRRRSFDEVAEDMLRPMLQEWLDNNLPTLVERLVREEIERVARGNPR